MLVHPLLRQVLQHARQHLSLHQHGATAPPALRERGPQTDHLVVRAALVMVLLLREPALSVQFSDHGGDPRQS